MRFHLVPPENTGLFHRVVPGGTVVEVRLNLRGLGVFGPTELRPVYRNPPAETGR